jgi:hypothetical protein
MSKIECQSLINSYVDWLKESISTENINGVCEITTPFLDRHNDHLQIYIKDTPEGLMLTDDGYTLADLQLSGLNFSSPKRQKILNTILYGFGVHQNEEELYVLTRPENFPQKKHNLIQAILSINDLFVMAEPTVARIFKEDVERFLHENDIRFNKDFGLIGKTGLNHAFDFIIPPSKLKPERILKAINHPDKSSIINFMFMWSDVNKVREPGAIAYAVLNDLDKKINPDLIGALKSEGIKEMYFSQKEGYVGDLAA